MVCLLLFSGYALSSQEEHKWGEVIDEEWNIGPTEDYPEAGAAILFHKGSLFVDREKIEFSYHVRIKILTKAGIEELGDVSFSHYKEDKIKGLEAHTITPDGKKYKVDKKEIYAKSYRDWRTKTIAFPNLDSGCVVEFKYRNVNDRYFFIDPWPFQSRLYTLYSEYKLILYSGFAYSSATINIRGPAKKPKIKEILNKKDPKGPKLLEHTWVLKNLLPVKDEPYMSFEMNYVASLHNQLVSYESQYSNYTYLKDWEKLGEDFHERVIKDYIRKNKPLEKITDSLVNGIEGSREKARVLYNYVTNEIQTEDDFRRYPNQDNISKLLEYKSGNNTDKNILLCEMLKKAGISAWPILTSRRSENVFMPEMYHLRQFDQIITMMKIDSQFVFLDTWSKYCPFGILPPESRTSGGLLVDSEESYLVRLLYDNPNTIREDITWMKFETDGSVSCSTSVCLNGYYAFSYGELLEKNTEQDFFEDYFLDNLDTVYDMDTCFVSNKATDSLNLDIIFSLDDYVEVLDNNYLVRPIRYQFLNNPFKSEKRFFPIDFGYPFKYINKTIVAPQDSLTPSNLPEPLDIRIDGAAFTRSSVFDGQKVTITSTIEIEKPIFLQAMYKRIRDFFQSIASSGDEQLIFTKSGE
jgi:hypothetical protein